MSAARMAGVAPSPIRAVMAGAGPGCVSLGLGEPGWSPHRALHEALAQVTAAPYGPTGGAEELRLAVAGLHEASPEDVFLTTGAQGAIFALLTAWLDPGDEVLLPDPGFPGYAMAAGLAGARVVTYPLRGDGSLDGADFAAALADRPGVRVAVVNHPGNPTGGGASRADLAVVAGACAARGVLLISDEVYRELHLGPRPVSLREVTSDAVVLGSVSKGWAAPGLRIGWAVGPSRWLDPARVVHNVAVSATSSVTQTGALDLLQASDQVLPASRAALAQRWAVFSEAAREHLGLTLDPPAGGFYAWLPLPDTAPDALDFALAARDGFGVVVIPGTAFGSAGRRRVRVSWGGPVDGLAEGVRRLGAAFEGVRA